MQPPAALGTHGELYQLFGGRDPYMKAVRDLEAELYGDDVDEAPKSA